MSAIVVMWPEQRALRFCGGCGRRYLAALFWDGLPGYCSYVCGAFSQPEHTIPAPGNEGRFG